MKGSQRFNPFRLFTGIFIPEALCKLPDLSLGAKVVYGRLCRYAGENAKCWPAIETLSRELSISTSSCRRYIQELEEYGLIEREDRAGQTSLYYFLDDPCFHDTASEQIIPITLEGCQNDTPIKLEGVSNWKGRGVKLTGEGCQIDTRRESIRESTRESISRTAKILHQNHPGKRRCSPRVVEQKLKTILEVQKIPSGSEEAFLKILTERHKRWCLSEDWTKSDCQYAKGLEPWLNPKAELYMNEPTAPKEPARRFAL